MSLLLSRCSRRVLHSAGESQTVARDALSLKTLARQPEAGSKKPDLIVASTLPYSLAFVRTLLLPETKIIAVGRKLDYTRKTSQRRREQQCTGARGGGRAAAARLLVPELLDAPVLLRDLRLEFIYTSLG